MASKVEIDRKHLKDPDPFFETVGWANRYFQENRALVVLGAVAIVALFIGAVSLYRWSQHSADDNAASFMRASDALNANSLTTARTALEHVEISGGIYGQLAKLYEADIAVREQRWDDALPRYEALSRDGETPYIRQIALLGKGYVLENKKDGEGAATAYGAAADIEGPFRERALRDQLRTARAAGKNDAVVVAIKKILEAYPETADADALSAELVSLGEKPPQAPSENQSAAKPSDGAAPTSQPAAPAN
jgi:hypothetical protein